MVTVVVGHQSMASTGQFSGGKDVGKVLIEMNGC